ncbi:hypothetical protein SDC9_121342 [bioreactor metagenome]|uniref:Uncharacterized protein n=1 Tax=bioreactor metagenome TaxID=1076179 RepID=A0A645CBP8_9ZZZZ
MPVETCRKARQGPSGQRCRRGDGERRAPADRVLLAVAPPADQQIGHHQHQRRPLRGRLVHRESQHEQRNGDDAAVLGFVCGRGVGVLLAGNPGVPRPAVHERVPGVVAGVVGFRPLLKAGRHRAFNGGVLCFNVVDQPCVQIIRSRRFRVKAKALEELFENVCYDRYLVLFGEHPDAEILGVILFLKLLTGQPQKR